MENPSCSTAIVLIVRQGERGYSLHKKYVQFVCFSVSFLYLGGQMRRTLDGLLDQNTADLVNYFGRGCTSDAASQGLKLSPSSPGLHNIVFIYLVRRSLLFVPDMESKTHVTACSLVAGKKRRRVTLV